MSLPFIFFVIFTAIMSFVQKFVWLSERHYTLKVIAFYTLFFCVALTAATRISDPDYENYKVLFIWARGGIGSRLEAFFYYFSRYFPSDSFESFVFVVSITAVMMKAWVLSRWSDRCLTLLLVYVCTVFLMLDVIQMRQSLAVAFLLFAHWLWVTGKVGWAILFIITALSTHIGSVFYLPAFLFSTKYISRVGIFLLAFVSLTTGVLLPRTLIVDAIRELQIDAWLLSKSEIYLTRMSPSIEFSSRHLIVLLAGVLCLPLIRKDKIALLAFNVLAFGFMIRLIFSNFGDIAFRASSFYWWSEGLLVSRMLDLVRMTRDTKIVVHFIVCCFYLVVFSNFLIKKGTMISHFLWTF
jgi:hypothetical protein